MLQLYLFPVLFAALWVSFAGPKADLQEEDTEMEVDNVFWNTRIVPILYKLETGNKKSIFLLLFQIRNICGYIYIYPHCSDIFSIL